MFMVSCRVLEFDLYLGLLPGAWLALEIPYARFFSYHRIENDNRNEFKTLNYPILQKLTM